MFRRKTEMDQALCELEEYRGTGLTPRQVRKLKREYKRAKEYISWLEQL